MERIPATAMERKDNNSETKGKQLWNEFRNTTQKQTNA